jgi:endoglucanase
MPLQPARLVTACARLLLGPWLAWFALCAGAATPPKLDQRMQAFRDGTLRGFALAELPASGQAIYTESDFKDLVSTGANVVRLPILLRKCSGCLAYDTPEADMAYAQRVLATGERLGFRVVVVLLATPWGNESDYWENEALKADIAKKWQQVAQRLKGFAALQAYDLINEPVVPGVSRERGLEQWHRLATQMALAIRAEDPDTPLMVEPAPWALPGSFWQAKPLAMEGVVYSFHLYAPHEFTHQGLPGYPDPMEYPNHTWNKTRLAQEMLEARKFAALHKAPMFVGEFSCVRWAPAGSCTRYLADAVSLFDAQGWGWAYHCWRCYQGWDAEVPQAIPQHQRAGFLPEHRHADTPALGVLKRSMAEHLAHKRLAPGNPGK